MKYKKYYIDDNNGHSNCVIRSFCKVYGGDYNSVYSELCNIAEELNCSFNDIEVFETYMKRRNTIPIDYGKDIKIKDLELESDTYLDFCWDKGVFYHMVPIINDVVYDKSEDCLELYTYTLYKKINRK